MLLRNLYEKTANFLGYSGWSNLLPNDDARQSYYSRIINFTSHSTLSNEVVAEPTDAEKNIIKYLLEHLIKNYGFYIEKILKSHKLIIQQSNTMNDLIIYNTDDGKSHVALLVVENEA